MEGAGLADPLAETGLFPAAARQMFRVGEETGTLDKQLDTAAAFYHRELEIKVKHFTSLFEPAVIIFMGVIVGFVAVALSRPCTASTARSTSADAAHPDSTLLAFRNSLRSSANSPLDN